MKFTIRKNCFETNSSSMHSIIITKSTEEETENSLRESYEINNHNKIVIWDSEDLEFGRFPFRVLSTFKDKLCFTMASYSKYNDAESNQEFLNNLELIIRNRVPDFKGFRLPNDIKDLSSIGYIDHQSLGLLQNFLKSNNVTIEEFLFNKKYLVIIDGDEYREFNKMMKAGIINTDNIIDQSY